MSNFKLTYTQAKNLINELGRNEVEVFLDEITSQPLFLEHLGCITNVDELMSLCFYGCVDNAHSATYHSIAIECMTLQSRSIEVQLVNSGTLLMWDVSKESFGAFCAKCCSTAVDEYVSQFIDVCEVLYICKSEEEE